MGTASKETRTVSILQSNYIPWKGYFDIVRRSDVFLFFDNVQSTKQDWRSRNRIKTPRGEIWLSIPIHHALDLRISEVTVVNHRWAMKHLRSIEQSYAKAPYMPELHPWLITIYHQAAELTKLTDINQLFIQAILTKLGVKISTQNAEQILPLGVLDELSPTERLVELARATGATTYLSGPAAKSYLCEEDFNDAGIAVEWMDYSRYREYPQLHGPFRHDVSILDLLLMTGPMVQSYL